MKKLFAAILTVVMVLSCTACSLSHGDTDAQDAKVQEYVEKYYGAATVVKKDRMILDTATSYTMKDKTDGFEYDMMVMEVYLSDLGFESETNEDEKILIVDGQFIDSYIAYLYQHKVDDATANAVFEAHSDVNLSIQSRQVESSVLDVMDATTTETAILMNELDNEAIIDAATMLQQADARGVLKTTLISVYTDTAEDAKPAAYYDFLFDRVVTPEECDGVIMLHDYLFNQNITAAKIVNITCNKSPLDITTADGFAFVDESKPGTYIEFEYEEKTYEFFTGLGLMEFTTEADEDFGIYEGSYLGIMANDRTGVREVLIAMYAIMYPEDYMHLTLHCVEKGALSQDDDTDTEDETEESAETEDTTE